MFRQNAQEKRIRTSSIAYGLAIITIILLFITIILLIAPVQ